jgi:hypothetical protein
MPFKAGSLFARLLFAAGALALVVSVLRAQQTDPQGGGTGGGRGVMRGGGQGPGPLVDPAQVPVAPGGRSGAPVRDNQSAKGTAKILGRVVSAETGNPLRRAQIQLTATDIRGSKVAATDNDGRYEFADLGAARYRLQVSKAGFVPLEYGQARPFESGKPLDVTDGQTLNNIDFSLPRGSVISGRVTDEFGDPIADASVQAMRYQFVNGQRQLAAVGRPGTSDDIGQFRIFGLMPGDYIVRATLRNSGVVAAALSGVEDPSGYPTTYYPGTTDIGQAQPVTVALGQEMNSVFFSLVPARLARISGTVIDSQGHLLTGAVVLVRPATGGGAGGSLNVGGGNQVRSDGTFTINNVPPGDYTLDVQQRPRNLQSLGTTQLEFASIPISVSGGDISGLTVVTTTGVSVSGRVVLEGLKTQGVSLRGIQVGATSPSGMQSVMGIARR